MSPVLAEFATRRADVPRATDASPARTEGSTYPSGRDEGESVHPAIHPMYVGAGYQPALGIVEKLWQFWRERGRGADGEMRGFRAGW
jgi:hypothetical protein